MVAVATALDWQPEKWSTSLAQATTTVSRSAARLSASKSNAPTLSELKPPTGIAASNGPRPSAPVPAPLLLGSVSGLIPVILPTLNAPVRVSAQTLQMIPLPPLALQAHRQAWLDGASHVPMALAGLQEGCWHELVHEVLMKGVVLVRRLQNVHYGQACAATYLACRS